jgi:hypothetical protein
LTVWFTHFARMEAESFRIVTFDEVLTFIESGLRADWFARISDRGWIANAAAGERQIARMRPPRSVKTIDPKITSGLRPFLRGRWVDDDGHVVERNVSQGLGDDRLSAAR